MRHRDGRHRRERKDNSLRISSFARAVYPGERQLAPVSASERLHPFWKKEPTMMRRPRIGRRRDLRGSLDRLNSGSADVVRAARTALVRTRCRRVRADRNRAKRTQSNPARNRIGPQKTGKCAILVISPVTKRTQRGRGIARRRPARTDRLTSPTAVRENAGPVISDPRARARAERERDKSG